MNTQSVFRIRSRQGIDVCEFYSDRAGTAGQCGRRPNRGDHVVAAGLQNRVNGKILRTGDAVNNECHGTCLPVTIEQGGQ